MWRIIARLKLAFLYALARLLIFLQSEAARLRTAGKASNVHHEEPYEDQPVVLLALFEKGIIRPDVRRLLEAAKAEGAYVLAVNTLRLRDPAMLEGLVDCYIERVNYGRDFGSYKTGFSHFFTRSWHKTCPRLLMLNDSVFFSESRLPEFLRDLLSTQTEVLGATENFEIEHHLGSFCVSLDGAILRHPRFQEFWRKYRLTDVRPAVIRRGEMGLSRALKGCASTLNDFGALYDSRRTLAELQSDPKLVQFAIQNGRSSSLVGWKRPSLATVSKEFQRRYLANAYDRTEFEFSVEASSEFVRDFHFVDTLPRLEAYLRSLLASGSELDVGALRSLAIAHLMETFVEGSQIHQNAALLLKMGLPIVKLDGMFRGMFSVLDVQMITRQLPASEAAELTKLLLDRPFGGQTLFGWKRTAFYRGLI